MEAQQFHRTIFFAHVVTSGILVDSGGGFKFVLVQCDLVRFVPPGLQAWGSPVRNNENGFGPVFNEKHFPNKFLSRFPWILPGGPTTPIVPVLIQSKGVWTR